MFECWGLTVRIGFSGKKRNYWLLCKLTRMRVLPERDFTLTSSITLVSILDMVCPWLRSDVSKRLCYRFRRYSNLVCQFSYKWNTKRNFSYILNLSPLTSKVSKRLHFVSRFCTLVMDISGQGCYSEELVISLTFDSTSLGLFYIALKFQNAICVCIVFMSCTCCASAGKHLLVCVVDFVIAFYLLSYILLLVRWIWTMFNYIWNITTPHPNPALNLTCKGFPSSFEEAFSWYLC